MHSIRKWMFKPKKTDKSLLAQFYYADDDLNGIAAELDSFDGRKEPERCTVLINKLRNCQDKVLNTVEKIMAEAISDRRASRDFRVKFPDDVLQDNLAGQLWFGAECLAAGSSIMNREVESASMRPLARSLTRHLDQLRSLIRDHCLRNTIIYNEELKKALELFDKLFAEFELSYVSAMVPVKSMRDYDILQEVMVLFSETVQRALTQDLITQDMIDYYDPALMFTIPRLAIVCGLFVYPEGPLNPDMDPVNMSEMFRPFQTLLYKIRELLSTLTDEELVLLEKCLCSNEVPVHLSEQKVDSNQQNELTDATLATLAQNAKVKTDSVSSDVMTTSEQEASVAFSSESSDIGSATLVHDDSSDESNLLSCDSSVRCSSDSVNTTSDSENEGDSNIDIIGASQAATKSSSPRLGVNRKVPHQESKDSGMPSEPDVVHFETHNVESHRLRHSRSWPDTLNNNNNTSKKSAHSKSPSLYECRDSDLGATGGGPSLELIASSQSDSDTEDYLNRSAQEFRFNIPKNTSLDHPITSSMENVHQLIPSIQIEDSNEGGGVDSSPSHSDDQVSFITDTFSTVFVTDPDEAVEVTCLHHSISSKTSINQQNICEHNTQEGEGSKCELCTKEQIIGTNVTSSSTINTKGCYRHNNHPQSDICDKCNSNDSVQCDNQSCEYCNNDTQNETCSHSSNNHCLSCHGEGSSSDVVLHDDQQPSTSTGKSSTTSACPLESCPCKPKKGGIIKHLEVPQTSRVHYRRMKSSDSRNSRAAADKDSLSSSDTASVTSDLHDETEISLAIQAAEVAARREARARFKSSGELIHRLFVCISGVADQLQTNYAADLRHILKSVFECNSSDPTPEEVCSNSDKTSLEAYVHISGPESPNDSVSSDGTTSAQQSEETSPVTEVANAPVWVPDDAAPECTACKVPFTFVRRRHHCRNCGNVFCGRCSSNSVPLPQYGQDRPVRVCNRCFMFHVTPFTTVDE